jgi:anaerobic ribonucleoside-triphosphate reductase activating protein
VNIAINKAHFPVTVLGPGRRLGIWVQGCTIHCKGCVSQDTWPLDHQREMPVAQLLAWCRQVAKDGFDGVTISGGEPFEQALALSQLLDGLRAWRKKDELDFDILCYSGYPLATLRKRHARLLEKLDAVIAEPYVDGLPATQLWRGSSNQKLELLSERGRERYADYLDAPAGDASKRMQVSVDGSRVWYIGIPARGDMQALEAQCRERGVVFESVSWRQ